MGGMRTLNQVSAGGVAYRKVDDRIEVALISVGFNERWQLPKGTVDRGESHEIAALREVREEAGIEAEVITLLDTVEYWYFASLSGTRVRYHKFVHFFLMRYLAGDVRDHDHEVNEARWVEIGEAISQLAFANEQEVVKKAQEILQTKEYK
jgi:8-oxo-dGTP diphosphatase